MNVKLTGQSIYKNQLLKKGLEFAADNGSLFAAGTSLALSTVARPLSILAAPKTDKENKKLACAKSISSSAVGYFLMLAASLPVAKSIKKINKTPIKYIKPETIKNLTETGKILQDSKGYQFATQLFKLGLGFLIAVPKSIMTSSLIPHIMQVDKKFNGQNKQNKQVKPNDKTLSFKGGAKLDPIAKQIGNIIDKPNTQKFVDKFKNSNFAMHITAMTDTLATLSFMAQTKKSKKIEENRKKTLNYNAAISTGLSLTGGYAIDKMLDKPTEKFIKKFSEVNKESPKLNKYIEGIKIAKPTLILGGIYYCIIPFISTFLADRVSKDTNKSSNRLS